jgi:hypothetical protein
MGYKVPDENSWYFVRYCLWDLDDFDSSDSLNSLIPCAGANPLRA